MLNWCDFDKSVGQSNACRFAAIMGDVTYNVWHVPANVPLDEAITRKGAIITAAWEKLKAAGIVVDAAAFVPRG